MLTPSPVSILWTARSGNRKTGNVPTAFVGATREESKASCKGCPLLDQGCYAHSGQVAIGHTSAIKAYGRRSARYTLPAALAKRHRGARMVRVSAIGDVGLSGPDVASTIKETIRAAGLALVGYTHHWRNPAAAPWKGALLASCETAEQADQALAAGWRASVVTPEGLPRSYQTPAGNRVVQCPATLAKGKSIQCNTCRLCDGSKSGPIIAFPVHGGSKRQAARVLIASTLMNG